MDYNCAVCNKNFKDETDLNTHTLFDHGVQRGYCENPHSKTHIGELGKLIPEFEHVYKRLEKGLGRSYYSPYSHGADAMLCARIYLRLKELDAVPKWIDITLFSDYLVWDETTPYDVYSHLEERKEEWEKIDNETKTMGMLFDKN